MISSRARNDLRADARGFTLIELLMTMGIVALLLTMGAFAVRHFWLVRSLQGAQDELVTQLRRQQQQSVAESHPRIYGVRFPGTGPGTSYGLLRVQLGSGATPSTCVQYQTIQLGGVRVFDPGNSGHTRFDPPSPEPAEFALCRAATGNTAQDDFVFFYARGTATAGQVTLQHPALEGRRKAVCVFGLTGRIEARDIGC